MKKTLIIKISQDISGTNDAQIEALKELWRATYARLFPVSFEITEVDEEMQLRALIESVRKEFALHDRDLEAPHDDLSPVQREALEHLASSDSLSDFLEK